MEHTHLVKGLDFALLQKVRLGIRGQGSGRVRWVGSECVCLPGES